MKDDEFYNLLSTIIGAYLEEKDLNFALFIPEGRDIRFLTNLHPSVARNLPVMEFSTAIGQIMENKKSMH